MTVTTGAELRTLIMSVRVKGGDNLSEMKVVASNILFLTLARI